jgi:uncharacterized coiled-coil DUF342 family protein
MTNEDILKNLEQKVKSLNDDRIRKTEQLRLLREQRDQLNNQLQEQGLDVNTLKATISQLETEITQELENLKSQIP